MDTALSDATVMVVDDDVDIRETISDLLEVRGFHVLGAGDGADAMAQLKGGARPQVILLDLMMPGLSGEEFRRQQLADAELAGIPVVLLSGARGVDNAAERMHVASLPKPVELTELMETVDRFCARAR
jgi:two-component system response regulator MprA